MSTKKAADENRTRDLRTTNATHYRLCYNSLKLFRVTNDIISRGICAVNDNFGRRPKERRATGLKTCGTKEPSPVTGMTKNEKENDRKRYCYLMEWDIEYSLSLLELHLICEGCIYEK